MSVKEFTVGVRHVVNLGNYETMHIEASVRIDSEDGDWENLRSEAQETLRNLLEETFNEHESPNWFSKIATKQQRRRNDLG
jgi:hypothetical protein